MRLTLKLTKAIILTGAMSLFAASAVFAAEKKIDIPVQKEYTSAKITFSIEGYSNETAIVRDEKGNNEYTCTIDEEGNGECVINQELKPGTWSITVYKENETDEEGNEVEAEIGKVKISFEGSLDKVMETGDADIKVATDIAGLKMYFKDDSFVATWTDTTCGNVNIEVINADNFQKIDSQTVGGRSYELPLDDTIKEIIVKIVPSSSSNIEGAATEQSFIFDNHPDATVTYEDIDITNRDTINATVNLRKPYSLLFMNNNKEFDKTDTLEAGEYTYEIPTEVGDNNYLIYVIDDKGNMRSTAGYVEKDVISPELELKEVYDQIQTYDTSITLEGRVKDYDYFTINDREVKVEGDWTFKYIYELKEGENVISIKASDRAGNVNEYVAHITRLIEVKKPFPWIPVSGGVLVLIGIIAYFYKKKHGGFGPKEKPVKVKEEPKEPVERKTITINKKAVVEFIELLLPLVVAWVFFAKIIMIAVVQSGSMEPTLMTGNTVFYNRLAYVKNAPKRGDVVIFWSDEVNCLLGKRIIGVGGDKVEFADGQVIINGHYTDESAYIDDKIETNCDKVFNVPEGCYFMLGDNRENSLDARYWKQCYIPLENIKGRYMGQIDFSIQYDILHDY